MRPDTLEISPAMTSPTASSLARFFAKKFLPLAASCALVAACSSETQPGNAGQGGKTGSGGATSGGASSGGASNASGGTSTSSGGTSTGSGGASSGGTSSSSGGSGSGGASKGGASSSSGGSSSGGAQTASGGSGTAGAAGSASGGASNAGAGGASATGGSGTGGGGSGTAWVGTWASGQQLTESQNNPPSPGLANNTLRQVVHVSIGGSKLRVRLSNEYGTSDATLTKVHIANTAGAGGITTSTDKELLFGGKASVTIPAGKAVTSDAIDFTLAPLSNLTISILFGTQSGGVTGHPGSRTTSYLQTGDAVSAATIASTNSTKHWYFISAVDVMADSESHSVAILGDSITDGRGTTDDGNDRWPDALAKRMQTAGGTAAKIGVLNLGIGGNTVVSGGLGPTAKARFDSDVVKQTGVKWAIVLEGVNDINNGGTAQSLIDAYKEFVTKAHAANIKIFGGTITPLGTANVGKESVRTQVNTWIRAAGNFDACIDFDNAVHDPNDTKTLLKAYWFTGDNDGLHLNPTGYAKMAEAVELTLFK